MLPRILRVAARAVLALPSRAEPVEIPPNVQRIERVPYAVLPDASPARDALITLAWRGYDVDAYQPHASREWVIWCKPGAGMSGDGRYTVEQWKAVCMAELSRLLPDLWKED